MEWVCFRCQQLTGRGFPKLEAVSIHAPLAKSSVSGASCSTALGEFLIPSGMQVPLKQSRVAVIRALCTQLGFSHFLWLSSSWLGSWSTRGFLEKSFFLWACCSELSAEAVPCASMGDRSSNILRGFWGWRKRVPVKPADTGQQSATERAVWLFFRMCSRFKLPD